jgi:hypothetical protein
MFLGVRDKGQQCFEHRMLLTFPSKEGQKVEFKEMERYELSRVVLLILPFFLLGLTNDGLRK